MRKGSREFLWMLMFLAIPLTAGWSQAGNAPPRVDSEKDTSPAQTEIESDTPQMDQSSPTSDFDQPSIGRSTSVSPSFMRAGVDVSGGAETYPSGTGNSLLVQPFSSILGSFNLQKLRPRSATDIDYVGGATFNGSYGSSGAYIEQLHTLNVDQHLVLGKTQLILADSFNYLRDGNFGSSSFGGASAYSLRFAGNEAGVPANTEAADYLGATQVPFGQQSYITNVSVVGLTQSLTRSSSISANVAYSIADFDGNSQDLADYHQFTTQISYNDQLNRRDSIGVMYGYQRFLYSEAGVGIIATSSAQFVYRHRIQGRWSILLGAGPELTSVTGSTGANGRQLNATAQASLQYSHNRYSLGASFDRLETGGFGVFAGGNSNIFRLSMARTISHRWRASFDAGYATSTSIESGATGLPSGSYDYVFAGGAVQRQLGPRFSAFASYQFNRENSPCGPAPCSPASQQHIALIGFDWNIRPIRLE
jgi:hypothetical protein